MFIVNSYQFASVAPAALLLDLFPATAAYSLRKLRTAYSGSAIRVRRSSDNAEQDIGFVGNDLDTASLLTFVGAGGGFVTTWYDQQENYNLTQGTSSAQPQIVSSGVIVLKNSKSSVLGNGTFSSLIGDINVIPPSTTPQFSYFSVSSNNVVSNTISGVRAVFSSTNTPNRLANYNDTRSGGVNRNLFIQSTTIFGSDLSTPRPSTNQRLLSGFINSLKNMSAFDNGQTGGINTYIGNYDRNNFRLFQDLLGFLNGHIQEIIIYHQDESANRVAIETNINDYYGIY